VARSAVCGGGAGLSSGAAATIPADTGTLTRFGPGSCRLDTGTDLN
jgi:hypothetical protein